MTDTEIIAYLRTENQLLRETVGAITTIATADADSEARNAAVLNFIATFNLKLSTLYGNAGETKH